MFYIKWNDISIINHIMSKHGKKPLNSSYYSTNYPAGYAAAEFARTTGSMPEENRSRKALDEDASSALALSFSIHYLGRLIETKSNANLNAQVVIPWLVRQRSRKHLRFRFQAHAWHLLFPDWGFSQKMAIRGISRSHDKKYL